MKKIYAFFSASFDHERADAECCRSIANDFSSYEKR